MNKTVFRTAIIALLALALELPARRIPGRGAQPFGDQPALRRIQPAVEGLGAVEVFLGIDLEAENVRGRRIAFSSTTQ